MRSSMKASPVKSGHGIAGWTSKVSSEVEANEAPARRFKLDGSRFRKDAVRSLVHEPRDGNRDVPVSDKENDSKKHGEGRATQLAI
jgi:hypothetical protein